MSNSTFEMETAVGRAVAEVISDIVGDAYHIKQSRYLGIELVKELDREGYRIVKDTEHEAR